MRKRTFKTREEAEQHALDLHAKAAEHNVHVFSGGQDVGTLGFDVYKNSRGRWAVMTFGRSPRPSGRI